MGLFVHKWGQMGQLSSLYNRANDFESSTIPAHDQEFGLRTHLN